MTGADATGRIAHPVRRAASRWAWGAGIAVLAAADLLLIAVVAELWGWLR